MSKHGAKDFVEEHIKMPTKRNTGQKGRKQEPHTFDISRLEAIITITRWKD